MQGILDNRCPAIVVADEGEYSCLLRGLKALDGFLRVFANWLLAQDRFPGPGSFANDFQVHAVGSRYVNHLNLWIGDDLMPVGCVAFVAETFLRALSACFHLVGAHHEPGSYSALIETVWNSAIGAAVNFAHPTHADHADTNCTCHDVCSSFLSV